MPSILAQAPALAPALALMALLLVAPLPTAAQEGRGTVRTQATPEPEAPDAVAADPGAWEATLEITFPADPRVSYGNDYHAGRSGGRRHKATDLMGHKLWKLYAAVDGVVCYQNGVRDPMPRWGYSLTVCGDDGRAYKYLHLNNDTPGTDDGLGGPEWAYAPGIRQGTRVERGQFVAYLGDSGNAENTAPHLHFEIHDDRVLDPYGDTRMNPYPSLQAARARADYPADTPGQPADGVLRVAGSDRVGTAVALSQRMRTEAAHVVLTLAGSFTETLAAGPLAAALDGPVLTTWADRLDPRVAAEIARLEPSGITLIGGAAGLPPDAIAQIAAAAGLAPEELVRVAAADQFATAAAVARRVWALTPDQPRDAVVAVGAHADPDKAWPDALTASAFGAATGAPVLFVTLEHLPPVTAATLAGARHLTIVGGTAAIGEPVAELLGTFAERVTRLSGQDRYATSVAVADQLLDAERASLGWVWAATGSSWADAATAGPEVARVGDVLVLIDGAARGGDGVAGRWLWRHGEKLHSGLVLGGETAVSGAAAARLAQRIT